MRVILYLSFILSFTVQSIQAQESVARRWNEEILNGIRNDFARPTVHARNLWHSSVAMYDIWAVYDSIAEPFMLGNTVDGYTFEFEGLPPTSTPHEDAEQAISHAMYRLMFNRFIFSPNAGSIVFRMNQLMSELGYDPTYSSTNYQNGNPAAFGNYVAEQIIAFGLQDGSNQILGYDNQFYEPVNEPLNMTDPEDYMEMTDPNRWQSLTLEFFIDQSGNLIPGATPDFLSPEWGQVTPFALSEDDLTIYNRDDFDYYVYHDPGPPPYISLDSITEMSEEFKWGFALVSIWSAHLDPADTTMWDISPGSLGNIDNLPTDIAGYRDFYDLIDGGDTSVGHEVNPHTGLPYEPNIVKRADYARVLAEFWADGPDSETPPGHWFTILNYVHDHPEFERKYKGKGEEIEELEWDVKAYMMLGGAMHDCAISAWGVKGYYDYLRPVSAIRSMAFRGQSTDQNLPNYAPGGIPLVEGYIELVGENDPLVGANQEHLNKIKLYAWRGPDFIDNPDNDIAGVGWILAENWWPYQRPSFVTPPFAGYVSGHSTYSRAAAEVLTYITGDPYFPGGMGEFVAAKDEFLVFEDGPSDDIVLQWATYRDASDQTSLSRIWGGIHPPADDIPGRHIGMAIAEDVVTLAEAYFFVDRDNDGYYAIDDCDDNDASINPGMPETCDGIDNNCSGSIDEGLVISRYFVDQDNDGFGQFSNFIDTCLLIAPMGYVVNDFDCDDTNPDINPDADEICDGIDNDCTGRADDGIPTNRYYFDADNDSYGDANIFVDTCIGTPPVGFVSNPMDCNDDDLEINPDSQEICDAVDNNCNGIADEGIPKNRYYFDADNDGYGDAAIIADTCLTIAPLGYVANNMDCDDSNANINPDQSEICDGIDNNCSGFSDDELTVNRYYVDMDNDGFGDASIFIDTCLALPPSGFVEMSDDCDDNNPNINPNAVDIPDNDIDEDCNGFDLYMETKIFPNPFNDKLTVQIDYQGIVDIYIYDTSGNLVKKFNRSVDFNFIELDVSDLANGVHYLQINDIDDNEIVASTIVKS